MSEVEGPTSAQRSFKYTHLPISLCVPWGGGFTALLYFHHTITFFKEESITYTKEAELNDYFSCAVLCAFALFLFLYFLQCFQARRRAQRLRVGWRNSCKLCTICVSMCPTWATCVCYVHLCMCTVNILGLLCYRYILPLQEEEV